MLNDLLMPALRGLHGVRIENALSEGLPDINFCMGWIESKVAKRPKRDTTVVRVDHFTGEQRAFAVRRRSLGGAVFVALNIDGDFALLDGLEAAEHLGIDWTWGDIMNAALYAAFVFNAKDFRNVLVRTSNHWAKGLPL